MRHKLSGYIFKMAAQHPKLASDSLEKIPDNIAVSFLPDFKSLSKKALEKGLNYFTQGYIHIQQNYKKFIYPALQVQYDSESLSSPILT
jgi:tyrosyl-tRNA synthetase